MWRCEKWTIVHSSRLQSRTSLAGSKNLGRLRPCDQILYRNWMIEIFHLFSKFLLLIIKIGSNWGRIYNVIYAALSWYTTLFLQVWVCVAMYIPECSIVVTWPSLYPSFCTHVYTHLHAYILEVPLPCSKILRAAFIGMSWQKHAPSTKSMGWMAAKTLEKEQQPAFWWKRTRRQAILKIVSTENRW